MEQEQTKEELLIENAFLQDELKDMKLILETVTGHSDGIEADLRDKVKMTVAESEVRFQMITETIPVPVIITRKSDGSILYANKASCIFFKLPVESLLKRNATEFYNKPDRNRLLEIISKHGYLKNEEIQGNNAEGKPFWAEISIKPFEYKNEKCFLSVWHDISRRKMLEQQLLHTHKMEAVGTLAGGIAHDFNNSLTIIFGNLDIARLLLPQESRICKNLNQAIAAAEKAKNMVRQILTFCRKTEQELKPFQIGLVVSEAANMISALLTFNIEVKQRIDAPSSFVMGDPTQIHQVVVNLCSNAGYAMKDSGGIIEIILEEVSWENLSDLTIPPLKPGNYIRLTVKDTGPGVNREFIDRVFDPFFTTKPPGEGTGMGLSVVHGILRNHKGGGSVENCPVKGAAFHCYFPIFMRKENILDNGEIEKKRTSENSRILYIDDEKGITDVYGEMLEEQGYQVVAMSDSIEAFAMFKENPDDFDLVITDNTMAGMTGVELSVKILEIRKDIPIILCSGTDTSASPDLLKKIGVKQFIGKPFTGDRLADAVKTLIRNKV